MSLFLWKKSYEIGVEEIDLQHRRLVRLINELSDAMMIRQGHREVPHILDELVDYIQLHFTAEEKIMQQCSYPGQKEHVGEHLAMTGKILEYRHRSEQSHDLKAKELLDFLCGWFKQHVVVNDRALGDYMRGTARPGG